MSADPLIAGCVVVLLGLLACIGGDPPVRPT